MHRGCHVPADRSGAVLGADRAQSRADASSASSQLTRSKPDPWHGASADAGTRSGPLWTSSSRSPWGRPDLAERMGRVGRSFVSRRPPTVATIRKTPRSFAEGDLLLNHRHSFCSSLGPTRTTGPICDPKSPRPVASTPPGARPSCIELVEIAAGKTSVTVAAGRQGRRLASDQHQQSRQLVDAPQPGVRAATNRRSRSRRAPMLLSFPPDLPRARVAQQSGRYEPGAICVRSKHAKPLQTLEIAAQSPWVGRERRPLPSRAPRRR